MDLSGGLLVAGTASSVGKSTLVTGLCRWLARQGVSVAPFKAQTLALHSAVTADGGEIGRAQAAQAEAAGIEPETAMNPLLLKASLSGMMHPLVNGHPPDPAQGLVLSQDPAARLDLALGALADLRRRFDVVVCEGAGALVEPGVDQIANLPLAAAGQLPIVLVSSVELGGAFTACAGTVAALDTADRDRIAGFVLTKHRGDAALLEPGRMWLRERSERPLLGVLPWCEDLWLDAEDSAASGHLGQAPLAEGGSAPSLRVAVVELPDASNLTDVDPLVCEPDVVVRRTDRPAEVAGADLVVLPGTRSTVAALAWLRTRGLDAALADRAARGQPVLGICGGYQLLGRCIDDPEGVERAPGSQEPALGLLPVTTTFRTSKVIGRREGVSPALAGSAARGYELRHGRVEVGGGTPLLRAVEGGDEGCVAGSVIGSSWHGLLDCDELRHALLAWVAQRSGRAFTPGAVGYAELRSRRFDRLADLIGAHLDTTALVGVIR